MHIMVIADTKVRNPMAETSWLGRLRHSAYHSTLRKGWKIAKTFNPDAVIFMGDMLASGRRAENEAE